MTALATRRTPSSRQRLDVCLVERGLAESREKAQGLVMAGRVRVGGAVVSKCGAAVSPDQAIEVEPGRREVGRGAIKLGGALDAFRIDPAGRTAVDVGASTGGFTEVLLARGALRVYAVDAGRGQLHESLRSDPRVVVLERTNARHLSTREIPDVCTLATMDVSFISVLKLLPALSTVLAPQAHAVILVKPQFEVGRGQVGKGGIVKDPALHRDVVRRVASAAQDDCGYGLRNACASPITGAEGNREFFLHLVCGGERLPSADLETLVLQVVGT